MTIDPTTGGFRPAAPAGRIRRITYEPGTDLEGLVIRIGGITVEEWMMSRTFGRAVELFLDRLVEWNYLAPDGTAVPTTEEGVRSIDPTYLRAIIDNWLEVVTDPVPLDPIPRRGGAGAPGAAVVVDEVRAAIEADLPMAPVG